MTDNVQLTHWGAYRPVTEGGRVVRLDPFEQDNDPSPIGRSMPDAVTDALRIAGPMVRTGYLERGPASREGRGSDSFTPVSWETATRLVANEIERVRRRHGNSAIFGGSYGWASAGRFHHAQSQIHRFLNLCGGYTASVNTHSHAAAEVLLPHLIGSQDGLEGNHTPWGTIAAHTKLFVAFGGLPLKNTQVSAGGVAHHNAKERLLACRAAGCEFVNIGPLRSDVADELGAEWLPARPNSDTALMFGLCHTLHAEGLHDAAFLERYTAGFGQFLDYLVGRSDGVVKDADWAAEKCGIDAEKIRALARRMASNRTMISVSWSLQRALRGEQPLWAAITLAAMLGQIGLPGGGFGFGYCGSNRVGNPTYGFSWPAFPQGRNPIRDFIPVARLVDMLLSPGEPFEFNGGHYRYPDIRLVYWAGGNPFHHQQDLNRLVRAWKRPETVVVHEPWWNPLARHADIVLPCTTTLERNDIGIARGEQHFFAMRQAMSPHGDARNDYDILAGIAAHLGFAEKLTEGLDEMGWLRRLYGEARGKAAENGLSLPEFDEFWRLGHVRLPPPSNTPSMLQPFREDPVANALKTPSGKIEIYSERIAGFGYADCPGHAAWLEPEEWLGAPAASRYPLHLISNQPVTRLHSQYDNGIVSRESKIAGREPVTLNPADASARGIAAGDIVRLYNERGACLAGAILSDTVAPGVVQIATGAWYDPVGQGDNAPLDRHGNPNVLTLDVGTSRLAQGPVAHSALVEVEKFAGIPPPVGAFDPPAILQEKKNEDVAHEQR